MLQCSRVETPDSPFQGEPTGPIAGAGHFNTQDNLHQGANMSTSFAGKTAVITGASRGIGFACADLLAARGANVVLNSFTDLQYLIRVRHPGPARGMEDSCVS